MLRYSRLPFDWHSPDARTLVASVIAIGAILAVESSWPAGPTSALADQEISTKDDDSATPPNTTNSARRVGEMDEDQNAMIPSPMAVASPQAADGWRAWEILESLKDSQRPKEGSEFISALGPEGQKKLWVGTRRGQLLSCDEGRWVREATLPGIEITGIALDGPEKVWLSTSDGIRRLELKGNAWEMREYHECYMGEPAFASGGYMPHDGAERRLKRVDGIYFPPQIKHYSPMALSSEHGLLIYLSYGIWNDMMPHYDGPNTAWQSTRTVVFGAPSCILEDRQANLWIGTRSRNFARMNMPGRKYCERNVGDTKSEGDTFSTITAKEIGCEFDEAVAICPDRTKGIWAILNRRPDAAQSPTTAPKPRSIVAHFDGDAWTTFVLPEDLPTAQCLLEIEPGTIGVGLATASSQPSWIQIDWKTKKIEPTASLENGIFYAVALSDDRVFVASARTVYEKLPQAKKD